MKRLQAEASGLKEVIPQLHGHIASLLRNEAAIKKQLQAKSDEVAAAVEDKLKDRAEMDLLQAQLQRVQDDLELERTFGRCDNRLAPSRGQLRNEVNALPIRCRTAVLNRRGSLLQGKR